MLKARGLPWLRISRRPLNRRLEWIEEYVSSSESSSVDAEDDFEFYLARPGTGQDVHSRTYYYFF